MGTRWAEVGGVGAGPADEIEGDDGTVTTEGDLLEVGLGLTDAREGAPPASATPLRPKLALVAADGLALVVAAAVTALALQNAHPTIGDGAVEIWWTTLATLPVWIAVFANQRLYNTRFVERRIDELRRIVNSVLLGTGVVVLVSVAANLTLPRSGIVLLAVLACLVVLLERNVARRMFRRRRARGQMVRRVVIAGTNPEGQEIAAMLRSEPWLGYQVVGVGDDAPRTDEPVPGVPVLGALDALVGIAAEIPDASVIVATSAVDATRTNRIARDLLEQGINVELSSSLRDISSSRLTVRPLGRYPVVYLEPRRRSGWRAGAKRTFDIVGAFVGLVLTAPVVAVAAIAIRLDSRGPILFRQTRVGQHGSRFQVLKLRSMTTDAEDRLAELRELNEVDGPLFKMAADPRVTRVGKLIRKTSIDEIPQLWNVLRGDMSLVGPRPALPDESEEWDALLTQRLRVKPGITGMWQVNGRSSSSFDDYTRLDLYYVDNWSITTDLAILAKTVPAVVLGQGAH